MENAEERMKRAREVRFLLLDVDGVMTDGTLYLTDSGGEMKGFHIHDGFGIHQLQKSGIPIGIITGRASEVVSLRARELGISEVHQGAVEKIIVYDGLLQKYGLKDSEVAYVGDDLIDLPILERVGLAVAVANAVPEVKKRVHWITEKPGGRGAVREVTDFLMSSRGIH